MRSKSYQIGYLSAFIGVHFYFGNLQIFPGATQILPRCAFYFAALSAPVIQLPLGMSG